VAGEQLADTGVSPKLRATLAAIKLIGQPVMESQIVADHTEVDHDGFVSASDSFDAEPMSEITVEIRSLQLRADSRDTKALTLNETTEGQDKYMLQLESRELRSQARKLEHGRIVPAAHDPVDPPSFARFDAAPTAG
jgi:hypothetical protein